MLAQYSGQDIELYKKYEEKPHHSFSNEYREKMENMVKQPVQRRKYALAYRTAMVCVCIIVALLIVNQASAYVFGMTLWDKLMEPAPEEMVTTVYQEKEGGRNKKGSGNTTGKERLHDIPTEILEGYELVSQMENEGGHIVSLPPAKVLKQRRLLSIPVKGNIYITLEIVEGIGLSIITNEICRYGSSNSSRH